MYSYEQLKILADRAYPGLKPTGVCSRYHEAQCVNCTVCYPDLNELITVHNELKQKAWKRLKELGEEIPNY